MLEAKFAKGGVALFKNIVDALKELLNEANFDFAATGIQIEAMDNSKTSLVSVDIQIGAFSSYRCDRNMTLGISLSSIEKILKIGSKEDIFTIKAQDDADVIEFIFETENADRVSECQLKLMRLDFDKMEMNELDYDCVINMDSALFARIVRDLSQLGDTITVSCTQQGVSFSCNGDIGSGRIIISNANTVINFKTPVVLSFASRYLTSVTRGTNLSEKLTLSLANDRLLFADFKLSLMGNQCGYFRYYLAAKIQDGD